MKRTTALFLTLLLCIALPTSAWAVNNATDLRNELLGSASTITLTGDIFTNDWVPVDISRNLTLDGNNFIITLGVNRTGGSGTEINAGLFGAISNGAVTIKNLAIVSIGITASSSAGGGLVGNRTRLSAGGFIGKITGGNTNVTIENSFVSFGGFGLEVEARRTRPSGLIHHHAHAHAGGFIGIIEGGSVSIKDSYFVGRVQAHTDVSYGASPYPVSYAYAGGLVGLHENGTLSITNSYTSGSVHARAMNSALTGRNASRRQAWAGGLVGGVSDGTQSISNSFRVYDTPAEIDQNPVVNKVARDDDNGEGEFTYLGTLREPNAFRGIIDIPGWDFDIIWGHKPGVINDYPVLLSFQTARSIIPVTRITGVPATAIVGTPLALSGSILPSFATPWTIAWNVVNAGSTGAWITGSNVLNTSATGLVTVEAQITQQNSIGETVTHTFSPFVIHIKTREIINKQDNFQFVNTRGHFFGYTVWPFPSSGTYIINGDYYYHLLDGLAPHEKSYLIEEINEKWGGSCFGMSAVLSLTMAGRLTPGFFQSNASNLYDFSYPRDSNTIMNLINYYQLIFCTPEFQKHLNNTGHEPTNIEILAQSMINSNHPVVFDFYIDNKKNCHATVGYDITETPNAYEIKIWDPNSTSVPDNTLTVSKNYSTASFNKKYSNTFVRYTYTFEDSYKTYDYRNIQDMISGRTDKTFEPFGMHSYSEPIVVTALNTNYDYFIIASSAGAYAIVEDGVKTSGALEIGAAEPLNDIDSEIRLRFVVPNLSQGESYIVTPTIDHPIEEYLTSLYYDAPQGGFFARIAAENRGDFIFGANGSVAAEFGDPTLVTLETTLADYENELYTKTITGECKIVNIKPLESSNGNMVLSSDSGTVEIRASGDYNHITFRGVDASDGVTIVHLDKKTLALLNNKSQEVSRQEVGYRIVFLTLGGTPIEALVNIQPNSRVSAPNNPERPESKFSGWFTDEKYRKAWSFGTPVTSDMILYALWEDGGGPSNPDPVPVSGVSLNRNTLTLESGESEELIASVAPENATFKYVTWSITGDGTIATVNQSGVVTANSDGRAGTVTVTATTVDGNYAASCDITVKPVPVTGVSLNMNRLSLILGASETLIATVEPKNATSKDIMWSITGDGTIATVSQNGVVTVNSAGRTGRLTVTATTVDGNYTARCDLTIHDAPGADGKYTYIVRGILYSSPDILLLNIPDNKPTTVKLLKDVDSLLVINGKIITFDLNGYDMTEEIQAASGSFITLNGSISGRITAFGDGTIVIVEGNAYGDVSANEGGTVRIKGNLHDSFVNAYDYGSVIIEGNVYGDSHLEAGDFGTITVGCDVYGSVTAYSGGTVTIDGARILAVEIPISVTPFADVQVIPGKSNNLTISVTEMYDNDVSKVITETFSIANNAADTYLVGIYRVYVDTKGNDQINACYIEAISEFEYAKYFVMIDGHWISKHDGFSSNSKPGYYEYSILDHSTSGASAVWVKEVDIAPAIVVGGVKFPVRVVNGVAILEPLQDRMIAVLNALGNDIVFDLSDYDAVDMIIAAGWFGNTNKTITIVTRKGADSIKTQQLWNNSGMRRAIEVRNGKITVKNNV